MPIAISYPAHTVIIDGDAADGTSRRCTMSYGGITSHTHVIADTVPLMDSLRAGIIRAMGDAPSYGIDPALWVTDDIIIDAAVTAGCRVIIR